MKVAITGASGFIGRHLVRLALEKGWSVRALSRTFRSAEENGLEGVEWVTGDLVDGRNLEVFCDGADALYHCAGQLTRTDQMHTVHVKGTQRLIAAATGRVKHWVQLSSVGVYGAVRSGRVTEDYSIRPMGEYEVTKAKADQLVLDATRQGCFTSSILRPSIVFGNDMPNQSLYAMVRMIDRGWFFFIGEKGSSANYIHVDDVAHALIECGMHPNARNKIYNLSDWLTMEEFVRIIAKELGRPAPNLRLPEGVVRSLAKWMSWLPKFPLSSGRVDALTNRVKYSDIRIRKDLEYRPIKGIKQGLREFVCSYVDGFHH